MSERYESFSSIPRQYWAIALRAYGGERIEIPLGTVNKAVAFRADWYHARAFTRRTVPADDTQAQYWIAIQNVSASLRASVLVFTKSVADMSIEEILDGLNLLEPEKVNIPLPEPTNVLPVGAVQEQAVEAFMRAAAPVAHAPKETRSQGTKFPEWVKTHDDIEAYYEQLDAEQAGAPSPIDDARYVGTANAPTEGEEASSSGGSGNPPGK